MGPLGPIGKPFLGDRKRVTPLAPVEVGPIRMDVVRPDEWVEVDFLRLQRREIGPVRSGERDLDAATIESVAHRDESLP